MLPTQLPPEGGINNYPSKLPDEQMQPMPISQPMNQEPTQHYTVGMSNALMYDVNQPWMSQYYGVPIGPTVQTNNH